MLSALTTIKKNGFYKSSITLIWQIYHKERKKERKQREHRAWVIAKQTSINQTICVIIPRSNIECNLGCKKHKQLHTLPYYLVVVSLRNSYNWQLSQLSTHIGLLLLFFNQNTAMWDIRKILNSLGSFISKTNKILTLLTEEHTGFGP